MVVACDHVLRPQIEKGDDVRSGDFLNVALVAKGDGMRQRRARPKERYGNDGKHRPDARLRRM